MTGVVSILPFALVHDDKENNNVAEQQPYDEWMSPCFYDSPSHREKTRSNKKGVAFSPNLCHILHIPSRTYLTASDKSRLWYSKAELHKVKEAAEATCELQRRKYKPTTQVELDNICFRGLENAVLGRRRARTLERLKAETAVLMEQQRQRDIGIQRPDLIANVYAIHTIAVHAAARQMGLQDAKEVQPTARHCRNPFLLFV